MAWLPAAAQAGGSILQSIGEYQAGQEEKRAYNMNADAYNQRAAGQRTASALTQFQKDRQAKVVVGAQRAAYAGAGIDPNTGTPLRLMADSLYNHELDKAIGAYNDELDARYFDNQAEIQRYYGKQSARRGLAAGGMTLLKSAADFQTKYGKRLGE